MDRLQAMNLKLRPAEMAEAELSRHRCVAMELERSEY